MPAERVWGVYKIRWKHSYCSESLTTEKFCLTAYSVSTRLTPNGLSHNTWQFLQSRMLCWSDFEVDLSKNTHVNVKITFLRDQAFNSKHPTVRIFLLRVVHFPFTWNFNSTYHNCLDFFAEYWFSCWHRWSYQSTARTTCPSSHTLRSVPLCCKAQDVHHHSTTMWTCSEELCECFESFFFILLQSFLICARVKVIKGLFLHDESIKE